MGSKIMIPLCNIIYYSIYWVCTFGSSLYTLKKLSFHSPQCMKTCWVSVNMIVKYTVKDLLYMKSALT